MAKNEHDSVIEMLLEFNKTHPVKFKNKWIAIGELEKMLDKLPTTFAPPLKEERNV